MPIRKPPTHLPSEVWARILEYVLDDTRGTTDALYRHLHECDEKWDSIRRIPYSAPGRWIQVLDLSELQYTGRAQALQLDSLLTQLFPLLPHLVKFGLNPSFSLAERWESQHLRSICGLTYVPSPTGQDEPIVKLELEVIGGGPDPTELDFASIVVDASTVKTLNLPHLCTLSMISMHHSSLMMSLLQSPLPSLRKLTLIFTHGQALSSLLLFTPKSWPTRLHSSPSICLTRNPLPDLRLEPGATHPLRILSIPRPSSDWWPVLEKLLPRLPSLCVLRMRDARWLRKGVAGRAQEAGMQGQMKVWAKRLARRRVQVVDADWKTMMDRA
ncbi:hypothetical protein BD626DRAFT_486060 [Schizophyllum amplum]|uniref:F-box domain-containing protein n=1 Tax=Schizophyllum amplum TaxID=97359 RepID=A0A550CM31_9AGAR|nr:hypothetical protein BD626DRAFT_486060 [Auriculariopsis ampla]